MTPPALAAGLSRLAADGRPDADLLAAFRGRGDDAAFAALVRRHGGLVLDVCRGVLRNHADAEDAFQATFLALARHANAVRTPAAVAGWLHRTAGQVARNARRARSRRHVHETRTPARAADPPPDPSWAEVREAIHAEIDRLPSRYRDAIVLFYLVGRSQNEVGRDLGLTKDGAKKRLDRGRALLRTALDRRGFGPAAVAAALVPAPAAPAALADGAAGFAADRTAPAAVTALVPPGARVMWKPFAAAVAAAGVAVAAWAFATADPPPRAADRALRTDPKAAPAAPELAGEWTATQTPPAGDTTRHHALRFLDADTVVWAVTQQAPGVRSSFTLRGRYERAGDEFRFTVAERYLGEEKLPPRADEKEPRVYRFAWDGPGKTGFTLVAVAASPDSPWAKTVFRKAGVAPAPAADPLVPKALVNIDRTLKAEPKYEGTPLYLLLALGPDSDERVWLVLDGATLYADRNGNGDLTEPGERYLPLAVGGEPPNTKYPGFFAPEFHTRGGKHTDFYFGVIRTTGGDAFVKLGLRVDGKQLYHAGPTNLRMTESRAAARVLPFGSKALTARPSDTMPSLLEVGKAVDFRVRVGTPGVGDGSFVAIGSDGVEAATSPVADLRFASPVPGAAPQRVTVRLTERCCGDQFFAAVTAPDGVQTGVNTAALSLTFLDAPFGPVAPFEGRIDVAPRGR